MIHYVDTSAYLKLIIEAPESAGLVRVLDLGRGEGHRVVSSVLLETELHRARHRCGLDRQVIENEVAKLTLISAADSTFRRAGAFPDPLLRSLDALHLATAIECGAIAIYTYDHRQADAATNAGIEVLAPAD
ncbi:MAG: type II toxin-antitoxin system VapC family toxin [Ilumatobacteraceae bacterium]|nr:type II toxin-antitoxin system VapC family toxin [Ilumatobacteraceae bacterium]